MTLYIRMQLARHPQYQLATELKEIADKRYFFKRALTPAAEPFLQKLFEHYRNLCPVFPHCHILEPLQHRYGVCFTPVAAQSFAHKLADAVLANDRESFVTLIERFAAILAAAQVGESRLVGDSKFAQLVQGERKLSEPMVAIGALDMNFDNILDTPKKPTIIDYEWTFPFAIQRDYIAFRAIVGLYGRIANRRPQKLCALSDALSLAGVKVEDFERFARFEDAFEELTSNRKSCFSASFHKMLNPLVGRSESVHTTLLDRFTELALECERKQAWILKIERDYHELKAAFDARSGTA